MTMPSYSLNVVILAAGQGKRMRSQLPKVLHPIAGQSLLGRVIDTARALNPQQMCVVYGHGGEQVQAAFAQTNDLSWAAAVAGCGRKATFKFAGQAGWTRQ